MVYITISFRILVEFELKFICFFLHLKYDENFSLNFNDLSEFNEISNSDSEKYA